LHRLTGHFLPEIVRWLIQVNVMKDTRHETAIRGNSMFAAFMEGRLNAMRRYVMLIRRKKCGAHCQ
jgi:hypothetical protein